MYWAVTSIKLSDMVDENIKKKQFFGLYNNVQVMLYCYLMALVHNQSDAEDLLQETAIVLWDKFDQFQEGTNFGAWAVKIAGNKARDFMRRNRNTKMFFHDEFYESVSLQAQTDSNDVIERFQALRFCLNKLPENSRKLLSMRYKKNISIKHISQLTGRSANGLYQSFSRLISSMRECMNKYIARQTI